MLKKKTKRIYNKIKAKTRKFLRRLNCSPLSKRLSGSRKIKNLSCYPDEGLTKMATLWNERHPDDKIESDDPHVIWNTFKDRFSNVCESERCWLRQRFMENNNRELLRYFSPDAPKLWHEKPYTWLNSRDIEKIMKQYEEAYSEFEFIGPSPIDFDKKVERDECVWEELCELSIKQHINRGRTKIGVIFNTDPHDESGEHWIALFIDIKNKFIFYFDSNGSRIPKEVQTLVNRILAQGHENGIQFKYYDNHRKTHQLRDGQCGMYTLYFIVELLLENKTPEFFKTTRITDEIMRDYRFIYFN